MAFKGQELSAEIKEETEGWSKGIEEARARGMGLASFLGGFLLPNSLGFTYPKDIASKIPESTRIAASGSRRMIYQGLKSDIKDIIKNPDKYRTLMEKIGITENKAIERGLKDYKERIKAVTAMPDSALARVKSWSKATLRDDTAGWWDENLSRPGIDKGGTMSITPHMPDQATSVLHEGAHAVHGVASKLYERIKIDPEAAKIWKTIPKESQETIKDLIRIDKFHRKWYSNAGARGREKYEAFYDVWPAEKLAEKAPDAVMGLASKLGRRLTMDEYYQAIKPITSKLQKNVEVLDKQFQNLDKEVMKQVQIEFGK